MTGSWGARGAGMGGDGESKTERAPGWWAAVGWRSGRGDQAGVGPGGDGVEGYLFATITLNNSPVGLLYGPQ